ncbi:MAG: DUF4960 domain-containing protein [Muribaculaceae bacterium]|nr:DUF4960 domain-containing protein [Muribaculaceae bacterium]
MKTSRYISIAAAALLMASCQNKDIEILQPVLAPIDATGITGQLEGDNYVWTWPQISNRMQVQVRNENIVLANEVVEGNSFTHSDIDTNIPYTYIFKVTDGQNYSTGVVKYYTRPGATQITGLSMSQIENPDGSYDALVTWNSAPDAENILLTATSGERKVTETLPSSTTEYVIKNVTDGEEWNVTLKAQNNEGASLPSASSLLIGKTAIGFLSVYSTPEELVANGDDDEACAWLWLNSEYPSAQFVPFAEIKNAEDLEPYRVLFWMRDLEDVGEAEVFGMPQVVEAATPYIKEWYTNGGNLLLWSHATVYVGTLGRIDMELLKNNDRNINAGVGGWNPDTWSLAVELHPGSRFKKDASSHPIFKGLDYETTDRTKLIKFKGAGWTEDHNCLFFNLPSVITGIGNQEEACYNEIVNTYGIIPLGTWDSQIDWVSQLNVWEAQPGNTEFKGTILCIGNGGCEFSLKNADGSKDISAYPKNNPYQGNVLTLAKNSLEYLKTK